MGFVEVEDFVRERYDGVDGVGGVGEGAYLKLRLTATFQRDDLIADGIDDLEGVVDEAVSADDETTDGVEAVEREGEPVGGSVVVEQGVGAYAIGGDGRRDLFGEIGLLDGVVACGIELAAEGGLQFFVAFAVVGGAAAKEEDEDGQPTDMEVMLHALILRVSSSLL